MKTPYSSCAMNLADYKGLISQMPVSAHAFTCSRENWAPYFDRRRAFGRALSEIFGRCDKITLSRSDLCNFARKRELDVFVVATILWGYPAGMRGTNVSDICDDFSALIQLLGEARAGKIDAWSMHCARLDRVRGVGLSTYTKFLSFLATPIDGYVAIILDRRIAQVVRRQAFSELAPIRKLTVQNGLSRYPEYLRWIHSTASTLNVPTENLEFFLFEFGGNLKDAATAP
jgi:hypothetical protein